MMSLVDGGLRASALWTLPQPGPSRGVVAIRLKATDFLSSSCPFLFFLSVCIFCFNFLSSFRAPWTVRPGVLILFTNDNKFDYKLQTMRFKDLLDFFPAPRRAIKHAVSISSSYWRHSNRRPTNHDTRSSICTWYLFVILVHLAHWDHRYAGRRFDLSKCRSDAYGRIDRLLASPNGPLNIFIIRFCCLKDGR